VAQTPTGPQPPPAIDFPPSRTLRTGDISRELEVTFPSAIPSEFAENQSVRLRVFLPAEKVDPVPVVVILHYWGATDWRLEERMAAQLNRRGVGAVLVPLPYHLSRTPRGYLSGQLAIQPDPEALRKTILQSVSDVRQTVNWIERQPDFRLGQIGIAGTSLGAIVAALAAGTEPRFTARCFVLGGVDLAFLLWNSSRVVSQREVMRRAGFTEARLREILSDVEPATYLAQSVPVPSLVIRAKFDTVIPPQSTDALIESLNEPQVVTVNTGHYGGVFAERAILREFGEFFQSTFFGTARSGISKSLSAPTIRIGGLYDDQDRLQVAAGIDLWRSNARSDVFLAALASPRGPRLMLGAQLGPRVAVGPVLTGKRVTVGLFWSIVL